MDLSTSDFVKGDIFEGGASIADEPLHKLLQVGNLGGFRPKKSATGGIAYVVLYSTGTEPEWPDGPDPFRGTFKYFGDNRTSGNDLLSGDGNRMLDRINSTNLDTLVGRSSIPPFFVFGAVPSSPPRSVRFLGLAVPSNRDWCIAKYFGTESRYLNFEITLDILVDRVVRREWIDELKTGSTAGPHSPEWFRHWIQTGESAVIKSRSGEMGAGK